MKSILAIALTLLSVQAFSKVVTKELSQEEAMLASQLAETYLIPVEIHRDLCSKRSFEIVGTVKGFNPANWTISATGVQDYLLDAEIQGMISLVDRAEVPLTVVDPITTETRVMIEGVSCDFVSMGWTVSFDDQKK
jgi:hypothetical protein